MRRDRRVHAVAWWLWAAALAAAALKITNPFTLVVLAAVILCVGILRQSTAAWGRSFGLFITLGLFVIAVRVLFQIAFGQRLPGHVLFTLPSVALPSWAAGVSIGGPVTEEALITAAVAGGRLALVLMCFGVANSVAHPREVLRSLPGIFNELAVAVTVALCFVPELVHATQRVHTARTLRGRPSKGLKGLRGIAVPVLEDALEGSMDLAASMEARGFGRNLVSVSRKRTVLCGVLAGLGTLLLIGGIYGLLSASRSVPAAPLWLGLGALLLAVGVLGSGRRSSRTRYRPAPFGWRSWLCVLSGAGVLVGIEILSVQLPAAVTYSPYPLVGPQLSVWAVVCCGAGLLALVASPAPQRSTHTQVRASAPLVEAVR